jgi:hypothetical protein
MEVLGILAKGPQSPQALSVPGAVAIAVVLALLLFAAVIAVGRWYL